MYIFILDDEGGISQKMKYGLPGRHITCFHPETAIIL